MGVFGNISTGAEVFLHLTEGFGYWNRNYSIIL